MAATLLARACGPLRGGECAWASCCRAAHGVGPRGGHCPAPGSAGGTRTGARALPQPISLGPAGRAPGAPPRQPRVPADRVRTAAPVSLSPTLSSGPADADLRGRPGTELGLRSVTLDQTLSYPLASIGLSVRWPQRAVATHRELLARLNHSI